MKSALVYAVWRAGLVAGVGCSAATVFLGVLVFAAKGAEWESRYLPVIHLAAGADDPLYPPISDLRREGDTVTWWVRGRKDRECAIASAGWFIVIDRGCGISRVPIDVRRRARIVGTPRQVLRAGDTFRQGPFFADIPPGTPPGSRIESVVYFNCHFLYDTPSGFGRFEIPLRPEASR